MKTVFSWGLLSLCISASALAQPAGGPKAPEITFQSRSVTVDGITAKGQVALFSVAREVADDDVATIVRRSEMKTDEDGDGKVQLDLDGNVPFRSIWVAVDLATGRSAVATPEGYPLRQAAWLGRGLGRENSRADRVEDLRTYADVILVRPEKGAWRATIGDGGALDDDGVADGKVAAALDKLKPLTGAAEPPRRFEARDVVFLLDPNRMEVVQEVAR
jgi:hypothetical protein